MPSIAGLNNYHDSFASLQHIGQQVDNREYIITIIKTNTAKWVILPIAIFAFPGFSFFIVKLF